MSDTPSPPSPPSSSSDDAKKLDTEMGDPSSMRYTVDLESASFILISRASMEGDPEITAMLLLLLLLLLLLSHSQLLLEPGDDDNADDAMWT